MSKVKKVVDYTVEYSNLRNDLIETLKVSFSQ